MNELRPQTVLELDNELLTFTEVPLVFVRSLGADLFARKNNKTLARTLEDRHYRKLRESVEQCYPQDLGLELGKFLHRLKQQGDPFYRNFLNPYGDGSFIHFRPELGQFKGQKGLYFYALGEEIVYIGLSVKSFSRRIGYGYGSISPKNCFLDGRSTNCRLNSLIASQWEQVRLAVHPMTNDDAIKDVERRLIQTLQPTWNVQLKRLP